LIGESSGFWIGRLQRALPVPVGEIPDDRIRFPQNEIAVYEGRHQPGRIHRQIGGRIVAAEFQPQIDSFVSQTEFADCPHDFLDVRRVFAAPNFEHDPSPTIIPALQ
jgi:hypothetical protein